MPSLPNLLKVKLLFTSENKNDVLVANEILETEGFCCADKDDLIEDLNQSFPEWHFFMADCLIKRVKALRRSGNV